MLTYDLKNRKNRSLYEALYDNIRQDILNGNLTDDERLPSKRALARHLGVSITTVENAYERLQNEGYIYSKAGSGFFVEPRPEQPRQGVAPSGFFYGASVAPNDYPHPMASTMGRYTGDLVRSENEEEEEERFSIDFKGNSCSLSLFPISVWTKLMRQILSDSNRELFADIPYNGLLSLRQAIADYLRRYRGMKVSPSQIIIGAGTEFLYQRLIQILGPATVFAFEDPGYKKLSHICNRSGLATQFIPIDSEGLSVRALRQTYTTTVHVSPANHFPTGTIMSLRRRNDLLNWAAESPYRFIVEDDYDSEFTSSQDLIMPLYSLDRHQRVIYINTFSKVLVPSIRISYMILPEILMQSYRQSLGFYACTASGFEQQTLARFINEGYMERHVDRLKNYYGKKRQMFIDALQESPLSKRISVMTGSAGTHLLLPVNTRMTDKEIHRAARDIGVQLSLLSDYSQRPRVTDLRTLVINFAGMEAEDVETAIQMLEKLFL